jgi:hypothetical protein
MGSDCESNWRKIIGKPYAGKLHVRFDEGELEIEPLATTPVLYSTVFEKIGMLPPGRKKHSNPESLERQASFLLFA